MHFNMKDEPSDKLDNEVEDEFEEEYEYEEDNSGRTLRLLSVAFVVAALGGFVALAWYAYQSGMEPISEADIPTVAEAEEAPLKEKPEEPGGWQFDHQDKSVYNQLAAGKGSEPQPVVERIMAPAEEPMYRPEAPAEPVAPQEVATPTETEVAAEPAPTPVVEEAPAPVASVAEVETPAPAPAIEKETVSEAAVAKEAAAPKPAAVAAPAPVKSAPVASGAYMAQLGAFGSEPDAEKAWNKVRTAHGSKVGNYNHRVVRADLGAKGVFYRLQMGPLPSESAARDVCAYLSARKQACFIVKN